MGDARIAARFGKGPHISWVYHVPGMTKNWLSLSHITERGRLLWTRIKVFNKVSGRCSPVMEGKRMQSVYIMSAERAYVERTRRNETQDL